MKRKENSSWTLIASVVGLLALFVLYVFVPGQNRLTRLRHQLEGEQLFLSRAAYLPHEMARLKSDIEAAREFRATWRATAPRDQSLAELYRRLTVDAQSAQVALVTIRPQTPSTIGNILEIPVELQVDGTFEGLGEFLRRLEVSPESVGVDSLKLAPIGEDGQNIRCELRLTVFGESSEFSD